MSTIHFIDQTIGDGQRSLWGLTMTTEMMLPIAPVMDRVGFRTIGLIGGRGTVVARRQLREDVFERFRLLAKAMPNTPLRSTFTPWSAFNFDVEPLAATELWIRRCVANGIRNFWVCNYQNQMDRVSPLIRIAHEVGAEVSASIMYTLSPIHTDELYAKKTCILGQDPRPDQIHFEDTGGVLTPERVRTLLPVIQKESHGIPIELHAHCNTGIAPISYLEGIKLGVETVATAVRPLANGASLPSTENIVENVKRMGHSPNIDEEALRGMSDYFRDLALKNGLQMGQPVEYQLSQFEHQLPGGMAGTLRNQLAEIHQEHRIKEVLEEMGRIRQEFGYPVVATPYSQIMGAQAFFNVTSGTRYKIVTDEAIKYTLEFYGELDGPMDPEVREKILSNPKAKKWINWKCPEITVDDIRKLEPGSSDDELLNLLANPQGEFKEKLDRLYGKK